MSLLPTPTALLGAVGDDAHIDDQLYLRARLVDLCFNRAFDSDAAGVWHAPGPLLILGGRAQGPSLSLATHWRAMVAARPREDRTVHIHLLGSGDETAVLGLDDPAADGEAPAEAVALATIVRTLARRGHPVGGVDLLRATDVPTGVGLGIDAAVRAATARAVCGLAGARSGSVELVAALDEACGDDADHQVCLTAPEGYAALARPGPSGSGVTPQRPPPCVRFDPAQHGFRLMLVTLRVAPGTPPPTAWEASDAEDAIAAEGFRLLTAGGGHPGAGTLPAQLGALLDRSHAATSAQREPAATDRVVDAAREAGALGARALSPRAVLAAVRTPDLATVRSAVLAACAGAAETSLGARFLTTAGLAGAGQGAGSIDGLP
ncbi:MAG TPA: hypothetical protein VKX24_06240 [Acidimicrobiia bacterium]|nr:hypothetical protein [Acidimicrobiia bacterium]